MWKTLVRDIMFEKKLWMREKIIWGWDTVTDYFKQDSSQLLKAVVTASSDCEDMINP